MMRSIATAIAMAALAIGTPATARDTRLEDRVETILRDMAGPGTRFGLVVVDQDGREVVAINPDGRFVPASNTKLYTTAAAFDRLAMAGPDRAAATSVRIDRRDVVIEGRGDARLSSAADCTVDCLAMLADAVAARTRRVRDVVGDDSVFPDERWSPGMSWNNIQGRYGTGISALTLDDNELVVRVVPGSAAGRPAAIDAQGYYTVDNRVQTVATGETRLRSWRMPNSRELRIDGTIVAGSAPQILRLGIDDPAHYAAWRMKTLLEARGVKVGGQVRVRHRPLAPEDDPQMRGGAPAARAPEQAVLAEVVPPPFVEDMRRINKESQNLHAELALRRVARVDGSGSIADGQAMVTAMLARAGVPRWAYDFSDGSGMSSYNRVTPRATVALLRWTATQPWGASYRETLPVGGVDGTLKGRFRGTPLEGKVFAKTGSLNQANALGGFLTGKSGRTLTFAAYANDMPGDASATKAIDAALVEIAAAS